MPARETRNISWLTSCNSIPKVKVADGCQICGLPVKLRVLYSIHFQTQYLKNIPGGVKGGVRGCGKGECQLADPSLFRHRWLEVVGRLFPQSVSPSLGELVSPLGVTYHLTLVAASCFSSGPVWPLRSCKSTCGSLQPLHRHLAVF